MGFLGKSSVTNTSWCGDIRGGGKPPSLRQREIFFGFSSKMERVEQCHIGREPVSHCLECQFTSSSETSIGQ